MSAETHLCRGRGHGGRRGGGVVTLYMGRLWDRVRFTKNNCLPASFPHCFSSACSLSLSSLHPSCRSFVLQGFGLDVIGDPPGSGQRQDGVVDSGHFHSQRDGVLVLAVHGAVLLAQGWDKRSQVALGETRAFYAPKTVRNAASATAPPASYLCRGGGLQSVKAKRSAERSLVKIGQIAGLEARGATNKAAQTHPQWAKTHQKQDLEFGSTCSEKSFPSMSSLLECPPGL